ncbi:hypothetical protein MMC31_005544, partial [Peltigera leucophlebia]|nr:hypothetical protein [Peltigera leucophlebia]
MVNLVGPPMVPDVLYLTRLAGDRPGLVMLKPEKPRRSSSAFGIIAIAQAISPFFFTEKSIKKLRRELASQHVAGTIEKPVVASGGLETVKSPAGSPASPPVEPPVEPPAEPSADPPADPPVEPPADPPADPPSEPRADPLADGPPAESMNDPPA